jgi:hypothetical protein
LFAMQAGPGHLSIYDLSTAAKLDQQIFSDAIAYTHFPADGNRRFVLTRHQVAYTLDVGTVRRAPVAASGNAPR